MHPCMGGLLPAAKKLSPFPLAGQSLAGEEGCSMEERQGLACAHGGGGGDPCMRAGIREGKFHLLLG